MEEGVHTFPPRPITPAESDGRRRSDEVRQLLDEAAGLDAQLAYDPSAREALSQRRAVIAANLLHVLQAWRRKGGGVRLDPPTEVVTRPARVPTGDAEEVRAQLKRILATLQPGGDDHLELERLHGAIRESGRWAYLPRELRRGVVALCTTRLRHLQDERHIANPRLEEAFAMLTAYSKREQPGFVVGLSRSHRPVRGEWSEDAAAWWERLTSLTDPNVDPEARTRVMLEQVATAANELDSAPAEARPDAAEKLRGAVRAALDGGLLPHDPRLVQICLSFDAELDGPEFRGLRRVLREPPEAPEAR